MSDRKQPEAQPTPSPIANGKIFFNASDEPLSPIGAAGPLLPHPGDPPPPKSPPPATAKNIYEDVQPDSDDATLDHTREERSLTQDRKLRYSSHHSFYVTKLLTRQADEPDVKEIEVVCFCEKKNKRPSRESSSNPGAINLDLFRLEKRAVVPVEALMECPYFRKKLETTWYKAYHVTIRLPRLGTVNSMFQAIDFLVTGVVKYDPIAMFEMLTIAHFLRLDELRQLIALDICNSLSARTIIVACHFAHKCQIHWLFEACYGWILQHFVETGYLTQMLHTALQRLGPGSKDKLTLQHGSYTVPVALFAPLKEQWLQRIQPFTSSISDPFVGRVIRVRDGAKKDPASTMYHLFSVTEEEPILTARYDESIHEYVVSTALDKDEIVVHGSKTVGYVKSNVVGTHFTIYDEGVMSPMDSTLFPLHNREEQGVVLYERNILGYIPRAFEVNMNVQDPIPEETAPSFGTTSPAPPPLRRMHLRNKEPIWNEALQAYTLDFGDAVKLPSKKNFQLVDSSDETQAMLLMFGKVRRDTFHIEFRKPMSALMAFGIILSSFDKKRFVT